MQIPSGFGAVVAVVVLVVDVVLIVLGDPPGGRIAAYAIGALAISRLT